jgi:hypothetical protein
MFIACFLITGCLKQSGYRDVSVSSIFLPGDTVISCQSFQPVVSLLYGGPHNETAVCTLKTRIWRYEIKMDSLCSISTDTTKPISVYDTSVIVTLGNGVNIESLPPFHPYWSDIYWIGQDHKIEVTVGMADDQNRSNDMLIDYFIVKARNCDLQVNYVGLLAGNIATPDDTISGGVVYSPVSVSSNSPMGPSATFRAKVKIIRENTNSIVYSRYQDRTLAAQSYTCIAFQTGWLPSDTGWYLVLSWLETRAGVDSIFDNNSLERHFYAKLPTPDVDGNKKRSKQSR